MPDQQKPKTSSSLDLPKHSLELLIPPLAVLSSRGKEEQQELQGIELHKVSQPSAQEPLQTSSQSLSSETCVGWAAASAGAG